MTDRSPALSRRHFLGALPVAVVLTSCSGAPPVRSTRDIRLAADGGEIRDVRDFGAVGDGVQDDSLAIHNAVAALNPGDVLWFSAGTYRFAQRHPAGNAAIAIAGISDVSIDFEAGAELLMDNLDGNGLGTSHGVVLRGPAERVSLNNVSVRWAAQPAQRSMGDGIRVVGYPSEAAAVPAGWTGSDGPAVAVTLRNCRVESSPQAGVIMMGVSDITVDGLHVEDTMADGLHFNACRRGIVENYSATNTGDDSLALVTYYSPQPRYDNASETFSFPALNEWSNTDFDITDVVVNGGGANGMRLAGVNRSTITGVTVGGKSAGAGVMVDSASVASTAGWHYVASRGVRLDALTIENSNMGLHVLARPNGSVGDTFSRFDLDISGVAVTDCSSWSVLMESIAVQPVTGVQLTDCAVTDNAIAPGTGAVGLQTAKGMSWGTVSITSARPGLAFAADNAEQFEIDQLDVTVTGPPIPGAGDGPFVQFLRSSGTVATANLVWAQAPSSWLPILVYSDRCVDGTPGDTEVTIGAVMTTPPKGEPVFVACR